MNFSPSSPNHSEKPAIEELLYYASAIEHKFATRRIHDIGPEFLDNIIICLMKSLEEFSSNLVVQSLTREIEMMCYAAIIFYEDTKYEAYFERLVMIAAKIRSISNEI